MNKLDTALVTAALKDADFCITDDVDAADIVIINTCSVRQHAEEKVFSHLGNLKHLKKQKPALIVALMGCMAQRLGDKLLEEQALDIVCGPAQIANIIPLIRETIDKRQKTISVTEKIREKADDKAAAELEEFETVFDGDDKDIPAQAFVRAMRGCNNFCSYCIVPYVRGPEISRPPQMIIEQIRKLAGNGVKLVTLLGQTVNSYQYQAGDKTYYLSDLLERASDIDGIEWIRFVTSYPSEKNFEQIISAMAALPKVCNFLHMCAQSGSDKIIKAMNRHYTAAQYLDLVDRARAIVPDIAVAGDFIVGFPDETDDDFNQTIDLVKKARYKNAFVFKYSPRPGTNAEKKLQDNISAEVKKKRNIELLQVQNQIGGELAKEFLDKDITVLVEGLSKKPHLNKTENHENPQLIARTATDWIVVFNGPASLAGQFAKVKITRTSPLTLFGRMVNGEKT